ncbi:hypothetical protein OSTOST_05403, partial [Ostertagia ostertagi]
RLSAVGGTSQTYQRRSERLYDVAYCGGLQTLSLPGTVTGTDKCDTIYSTMSHQLLKRVETRNGATVKKRKRILAEEGWEQAVRCLQITSLNSPAPIPIFGNRQIIITSVIKDIIENDRADS